MWYTEAWGKLINEKNLKSKILWNSPFKKLGFESLPKNYQGHWLKTIVSCHMYVELSDCWQKLVITYH